MRRAGHRPHTGGKKMFSRMTLIAVAVLSIYPNIALPEQVISSSDGMGTYKAYFGSMSMDGYTNLLAKLTHGEKLILRNILPPVKGDKLKLYKQDVQVNKKFYRETILWVEPARHPKTAVAYASVKDIPDDTLQALGFRRETAPKPNIYLRFRKDGQRHNVELLVGDGSTVYGATRGPVSINGKEYRNINGWVIRNRTLVPRK